MRTPRALVSFVMLASLAVGLHSAAAHRAPSAPLKVAPAIPPDTTADPVSRRASEAPIDPEAQRAEQVLAGLRAKYRYLDDVKVSLKTTPNGEQAVAYYTLGRIVIDRNHTIGIDKILAHEIWHVIDWRDNGRLDWGEDLPPNNSYDYVR